MCVCVRARARVCVCVLLLAVSMWFDVLHGVPWLFASTANSTAAIAANAQKSARETPKSRGDSGSVSAFPGKLASV